MNQLPRQGEYDKWLALGILALVFVVAYFLIFQGFFTDHQILNEEITDLEETRKEHTELAYQIPELQNRIQKIQSDVGDNTSFLRAGKTNIGTTELRQYLKQALVEVTSNTSECNITSQSPSRDREPDQFEKIVLKVRLRCQYSKLVQVLDKFEKHVPLLFVKEMNLQQRAVRSRVKKGQTPPRPLVDVNFDLYAYMNKVNRKSEND